MAEKIPRKQIEKEAEEHISLGLLLRRQRSEQMRAEVERIMTSSFSVSQKIDRIRRLDEQEETAEPQEAARESAEGPGRLVLAQALQAIKIAPSGSSYLNFLLRDYGKIREFGSKTHVLRASWLPPGVKANPEIRAFFEGSLQPWAMELSRRLHPALELGWLHLTKRQYNLIVVLKRLCDRILSTDFAHLNYRDRNLMDALRRLEAHFLILQYGEGSLQDILFSLRTVFEKKSKLENEYSGTADLVVRILSRDVTLPSLYNCLLGLNMVKHRRFLTLAELMRKNLGELVSSKEYDCPPHVRKKIEEFLESSMETLQALHEQLYEIRRLNSYLAYEENGELDTRLLRSFYESKSHSDSFRLDSDRENLMLFAPRFFTVFERTFLPLLNGSVPLEAVGKAVIFSPGFFQVEFSRLSTVTEKLEKSTFTFANFPYKRYLSIRSSSMGAIPKEIEVMQLIDEGLAVIFALGKAVAKVLGLSGMGATAGAEEGPLEPTVLQGKPFRLPYADRRIHFKGFLQAASVSEALSRAITICFTAGILFQDPAIFMLLGKEGKIAAQLHAKIRKLEHIVDARSFEELKLRYA